MHGTLVMLPRAHKFLAPACLLFAIGFLMGGPTAEARPHPDPTLATAKVRPDLSFQEKDYLFPDEVGERRITPAEPGKCFDCSEEIVTYRDFGGNERTMIRYTGRYVSILVPQTWPHDVGFTRDELEILLDRSDILYVHFRDLLGREPGGEGPLPIAFVPETCGWGCGFVGGRGVEILDADWSVEEVRLDLNLGALNPVIVHEMTHNFDVYSHWFRYLSDHAHAWTDFIQYYIHGYSRLPFRTFTADEWARSQLETRGARYFDDPDANWADCVRDENCPSVSANAVWGGVGSLLTDAHGPDAAKGAFEFMRDLAGQAPPTGPENREDLRLEAWAAGTDTNLGCYADTWRWQASQAVRNTMSDLYGDQAAMCQDGDGDGVSPVAGDCDDSDPTTYSGATELADGRDNDCDNVVDNLLLSEGGGDFPGTPTVQLPVQIEGRITAGDGDSFFFDQASPGQVRFELCSVSDFSGWLFVYANDGSWLDFQYTPVGQCSTRTYDIDQVRRWRFSVDLNVSSSPGEYTVRVVREGTTPQTTVEVEPSCTATNVYPLVATAQDVSAAPTPPTDVKFWVSGLGFVGSAPYTGQTVLNWQPPEPLDDGYAYRAQLFADGNPVSDASPAQGLFQSDVDADDDGIPDACDPVVAACDPSAPLCLNGNRFQVDVTWRDFEGVTGVASAVPFSSNDSGLLWFFGPDNWEMLVKVLDGCPINGHFWVFSAATTNVEYTLRVTDIETGVVAEYFNPLGNAAAAITDTAAFDGCP